MIKIMQASINDLGSILELQYTAYQSEARLVNDFNIQPLKQTLEEVIEEYNKGVIFKAVDDSENIVGSVRGYIKGNIFYVGKLMVHPKHQKKGIGAKLLQYIDSTYQNYIKELYTSDKSLSNLRLYEKMGYEKYKKEPMTSNFYFIYMRKK